VPVVPPLQQPPAHEAASQMHVPFVVLQARFAAQDAHVAPAVPHDPNDSDAYASHVPPVPPLQQPFGQVFASHAQVPMVVSQSPSAQGAHAAPLCPQAEDDSFGKVTQAPLLQQPFAHELASQTHRPVVRSHSWPCAHPAQVIPPVPHELFVSAA
jgi:hypothetical protein